MVRQSSLIGDSCVIGAMVDGNVCRSAVNDGSCSPWVMCSSSVVRGNQIRDRLHRGKNKLLLNIYGVAHLA